MLKIISVFTCLLMLSASLVSGQSRSSELYTAATHHLNQANFDSAMIVANLAREAAEQEELWDKYILSDLLVVRVYLYQSEFDYAKATLEKCEKVAQVYFTPGDDIYGEIYHNLGVYLKRRGQIVKSIPYLQDAASIFQKSDLTNELKVADVYVALADAYMRLNAMAQAKKISEQAQLIYRKSDTRESRINVFITEFNIGIALSGLARYEESMASIKKAAKAFAKEFSPDNFYNGVILDAIGAVNIKLENYDSALSYCHRALVIHQKNFGAENMYTANVHFNLAYAYELIGGQLDSAKHHYDLVLRGLELAVLDDKHPLIAWTHQGLGRVYSHMGMSNSAESHFEDARVSNSDDNPSRVGKPLDPKRHLEIRRDHGNHKVSTFLTSGSSRPEILTSALDQYQKGLDEVEEARSYYSLEEDKIEISKTVIDLYKGIMNVCALLEGQKGGEKYRELAFEMAERSKGNVLLEAVTRLQPSQYAGVPVSLVQAEARLRDSVAITHQMLLEEKNADSRIQLSEQLNRHARALTSKVTQIKSQYPDYYQLTHQSSDFTIETAQHSLARDEALISYFYDEEYLYSFLVTHTDLVYDRRPLPEKFHRRIRGYHNSLIHQVNSVYLKEAQWIYQQLFPFDIPPKVTKLTIIPQGILANIPFEALLTTAPTSQKDWQNMPYLIQQYNISYSYSASLYIQMKNHKAEPAPKTFVGFAPVFAGQGEKGQILKSKALRDKLQKQKSTTDTTRGNFLSGGVIAPIHGTEDELLSIHDLWSDQGRQSQIFTHLKAREEFFKSSEISQYRIIHLATHGIVDEDQPELSALILAQIPDSPEDGILYAGEIYSMKFNADLVVLSACETGLGKVDQSEGIIGFTRAFMYAGARNLIVSQWQVADRSSSYLMKRCYEKINLTDQHTRFAEPLRASKLQMIQEGKYAHPYYWSPFVLIGS